MKRLYNIDYVRGSGAFIIMIYHYLMFFKFYLIKRLNSLNLLGHNFSSFDNFILLENCVPKLTPFN